MEHNQVDRYIKTALSKLNLEYGLFLRIGSEIEFYLFDNSHGVNKEIDLTTISNFSSHISNKLGMVLEKEKGLNQYEIIVPHQEDIALLQYNISRTKSELISIAKKVKLECVFSPKPKINDFGSGMHYHITLHKGIDRINIFDIDKLSLMHIIAGILYKLTVALPWLLHNQYYKDSIMKECERFVPKFMAPTNISWGGNNRTTAIRIPDDISTRIEFRIPSPVTSSQKVIAFILSSILFGIKYGHKLKIPSRIYGNAYDEQYMEDLSFHCGNILSLCSNTHTQYSNLQDILE